MMLAEKLVLDHLSKSLDVPVYMEHQAEDPQSFVIVERVGGSVSDHIHRVSFAIQSYGTSLLTACELNEKVKQAMDQLIESDSVVSVTLDSDYNHTDTSTKRYRYQAVYDLVLFD